MHPKYVESERLGREITELCGHLYAATYRLLTLIGEFDEKGGWELPGLVSCAHWLNYKCGIGVHAAREKVRVARALKALPLISEAMRRGELSYSKVRAMTRIADESNERYLLMIARHGTAYHVERLVSQYRRCRRAEELQEANARHARRSLEYSYDDDGCLVLKARLPAELGQLVLKGIEFAMAHDDSMDRACGEIEPGAADRRHDSASYRAIPDFAARRADALTALAGHYLHRPPASEQPSVSTADRYQVVVHVPAEVLTQARQARSAQERSAQERSAQGRSAEGKSAEKTPMEGDGTHLEGGPHVPAETARRLACDGSIVPLLEGADERPLAIGRKTRSIPPALRRALKARDKGCRFPGCINRHNLDAHHIVHWADGGETSLDNTLLFCRYHHRLHHEGGFCCQRLPGGGIEFRDRYGRLIEESPAPETAVEAIDERTWFEAYLADLDIDADTCVTRWEGERIDWPLAVGHLFR